MRSLAALGLVPLLGLAVGLPALVTVVQLAALVWIIASVVALASGLIGRHHESPGYARGAVAFVVVVNAAWIVWWVGDLINGLSLIS